MRQLRWVLCLSVLCSAAYGQSDAAQKFLKTPYENTDGWETPTYESGMRFWNQLADLSPHVSVRTCGMTDSGLPLHLVLFSGDRDFDVAGNRRKGRSVLLINNAIHAGESDGVDASMLLLRDLAADPDSYRSVHEKVLIAVIPFYSIGGALNRNRFTRANQNGPREYGFRGNAKNLDLNRDFMKCDSENARSFARIFHELDPDLFIDTHVSNGSDHQHVMTTSHSQKDKLGLKLGTYLDRTFEPQLFARMADRGFPTVPYVNSGSRPPDEGFSQFLETPRYSTGYAALFQTMGFMSESHALKPYPQRVKATRVFLEESLKLLAKESDTIRSIRRADRGAWPKQTKAAVAWTVDRNRPTSLEFQGYEARYADSRITPGKRLLYDRSKPFTRTIPYFNHYRVSRAVSLPAGYLIPRAWRSVTELMKLNQVQMYVIKERCKLPAEICRIDEVKSREAPYEGHFFHDTVRVSLRKSSIAAEPGDVVIPIQQDRARYVVEALEPEAMDSLFRWNYFDSVLQRKEYFSPYIFEDRAAALLAEDAELKAEFESRKKQDPEFAGDRRAQLEFLYRASEHYEKTHRIYPIVRLQQLPDARYFVP